MPDMGWWEAILAVLRDSNEAMHYTDIADEIVNRGLRTSVGATPANTVNVPSDSLNRQGVASPFERTARGFYRLRSSVPQSGSVVGISTTPPPAGPGATAEAAADIVAGATKDTTGLINALGMYWSRDKINWNLSIPKPSGGRTLAAKLWIYPTSVASIFSMIEAK